MSDGQESLKRFKQGKVLSGVFRREWYKAGQTTRNPASEAFMCGAGRPGSEQLSVTEVEGGNGWRGSLRT